MKVVKNKFAKLLKFVFCLVISLVLLGLIYWRSLPQKYDLKVGQISQYDIVANRNLIDYHATKQKAIAEAGAISPIFVRSEELANKSLEQLEAYLSLIYLKRLPVWQEYAATIGEPLPHDLVTAMAAAEAVPVETRRVESGTLTAGTGDKGDSDTDNDTVSAAETGASDIAVTKATSHTDTATTEQRMDNAANVSGDKSVGVAQAERSAAAGKTATTGITAMTGTSAESGTTAAGKKGQGQGAADTAAASASASGQTLAADGLTQEELEAEAAALQAKIDSVYPGAEVLADLAKTIDAAGSESGIRLSGIYTTLLAEVEPSIFLSLAVELKNSAKNIMSQELNRENLDIAITRQTAQLVSGIKDYKELYAVAAPIYRNLLVPNLRYDAVATGEARKTVYERAMNNPIQIHRGTRIVNYNDIISEAQYANLHELNLLKDDKPNYSYLFLLLLMYVFCTGMTLLYFKTQGKNYAADRGSDYILFYSAVLVIAVSLYTSSWSDFFIPLPFFILISATYFSPKDSMYMSMLLLIFLSIFSSNLTAHFIVYAVAVLLINVIMKRYKQRSNYLVVIVAACAAMFLAATFYACFDYQDLFNTVRIVSLCLINGLLSALAAIGVIPLLDFIFASVSPMRLVALAQPDAPLMKRMFMEALGTYQHSMMVANLAENAAQAVGANTLLCRVGGYYHDIGKLQAPLMFTENQDDYNPHDDLSPESSYAIITRHVAMGQKIAKRYRLPQALINIIREHHGTTVLFYFYKKAEQEHKQLSLPSVEKRDWQYPWNSPGSKEAAIVMLADSVEAAMKSTGYRTVEEMEKLARNIVRDKNSQDQLKNSGLSYQDVEDILEAFKRVYVGVFKERVKYPDVSKS